MRRALWVSMLLILVAGCKSEPPPPPEPEAPPPPSADQIRTELKSATQRLFDAHHRNAGLPNAQREATVNAFRSTKSKHTGNPNLEMAIRGYTREVETLLKDARTQDRWRVVKGACQILRDADPAGYRHEKLEHRADLILARPVVTIRGFFVVDEEINVFFSVRDQDTNKYTTYEVREGEQFHEVFRLTKIIGNKEACELMYLPIDDPYIIQAPSSRREKTIFEQE